MKSNPSYSKIFSNIKFNNSLLLIFRYGFGVPFQGTLTTIIDTDYDDYAVVYSCTNSLLSGVFHSEYIWVLSRSGKISNPTRQNIYEKLDKLQINRSGLTMSDRSTCPTNSSTVARESDKDLATQGVLVPSAAGAAAGVPVAGDSGSSLPATNLEKANPEPTQKSVVVPLLYDAPSPVSSSSVGSNSKPNVVKAPPAPVENKVPQLPLSSSISSSQLKQQPQVLIVNQSSGKQFSGPQIQPQQQQAAPIQQQQQSPPSSASQPAQVQSQSATSPVQPSSGVNKQSAQQPQQQSLMAKIQQKP